MKWQVRRAGGVREGSHDLPRFRVLRMGPRPLRVNSGARVERRRWRLQGMG